MDRRNYWFNSNNDMFIIKSNCPHHALNKHEMTSVESADRVSKGSFRHTHGKTISMMSLC